MMKQTKDFFLRFLAITFVVASLIVFIGKFTANFIYDLPSVQQLSDYNPSLSTKIYDKDNNLIAELFDERRVLASINNIPANLLAAFITIEDNNFFKHWGISLKGIMRAFLRILSKGRIVEGGSTITQQLAKTIFLTRNKTISRKIKEIFLTIQLEKKFSKNEILQFYMNQIYFGSGAHGVQAASEVYFNKDVQNLNLAECATLAAIPKHPNYYNPFKNAKASLTRRNLVLARMRELGYITKKQEEEALKFALPTKKIVPKEEKRSYFIEFLKITLEPKYGSDILFKAGLSIYTTLDMQAQKAAEKAVEDVLAKFDEDRPKHLEGEKLVKTQGALIAIDPKNGAIRAMVGGRSFNESQFNRTIQAKRQAGSVFKPFVYLTAIKEAGFTPATIIEDEPMIFIHKGNSWNLISRDITTFETMAEIIPEKSLININKIWVPINYNNAKHRGPVTLRTAIAASINMCAVETIMKVTPIKVIQTARSLGITTPLTNSFSLALGSSDVILQEMVSAFATLASNGIKTVPYVITKIVDRDGKTIEETIPEQKEVLSSQDCFIMTNMLRGAVEKGTGWRAKSLGRPCAGKTGTSNNSSDAWFIGYTPQLVAGVWVGYDDHSISLGNNVSGSLIACPIWTQFMKEALDGEPILDFVPPENIELVLIEPTTGLLALNQTPGAFLEAFKTGTTPTEYYRSQN